jgi:antitoxin CptB
MSADAATAARLRWRCRRGMRELDVLLGAWLEQCWPTASAASQSAFEQLLACEDDQIWDWLMGRTQPPDDLATLVEAIRGHNS